MYDSNGKVPDLNDAGGEEVAKLSSESGQEVDMEQDRRDGRAVFVHAAESRALSASSSTELP